MEDYNVLRQTRSAFIEAVRPEALLDGSSQLQSVARDLSQSVCEAAGVGTDARFMEEAYREEFVEDQAYRLKEILSAIPSAFHNCPLSTTDGRRMNPFELTPAKFLETLPTIKDLSPEKLKEAYGTIWTHVRVTDGIINDEQISQRHLDLRLYAASWPDSDAIGNVARLYLDAEDFVSPTLEWALVDALIHGRIIDFARTRSYAGQLKATPSGQRSDGPLLPGAGDHPMGAKSPGIAGILGREFSKLAARGIGETVALLLTWWVVGLVAGNEGAAKWILFTGVTAARWIVAALHGKSDLEREERERDRVNLQMFWDMQLAHDHVPGMNVKLLQHLFYRLEERGAGFSVYVYDILDKRAKREARR